MEKLLILWTTFNEEITLHKWKWHTGWNAQVVTFRENKWVTHILVWRWNIPSDVYIHGFPVEERVSLGRGFSVTTSTAHTKCSPGKEKELKEANEWHMLCRWYKYVNGNSSFVWLNKRLFSIIHTCKNKNKKSETFEQWAIHQNQSWPNQNPFQMPFTKIVKEITQKQLFILLPSNISKYRIIVELILQHWAFVRGYSPFTWSDVLNSYPICHITQPSV